MPTSNSSESNREGNHGSGIESSMESEIVALPPQFPSVSCKNAKEPLSTAEQYNRWSPMKSEEDSDCVVIETETGSDMENWRRQANTYVKRGKYTSIFTLNHSRVKKVSNNYRCKLFIYQKDHDGIIK